MRNVIQDVLGNLSLILGTWIIACQMPKRKPFAARLALILCVICVLRYTYFYITKPYMLTFFANAGLVMNTLGFILLILMIVGATAFLFECGFWPALFCGGVSYCIQHIGQRLYRLMSLILLAGAAEPLHILAYVSVMAACMGLVCLLVRKMHIDKIVVDNKKLLLAVLAVVFTAIALDLVFLRALKTGGELLQICFTSYSVMTSALIVWLMLGMVSSKKVELELDTIKSVLKSEQEQYYYEKSLIDTINIKCHDLRHQIALLECSAEDPVRRELGDELRAAVNAYDSSFHTGNIALDVVLTRESFNCGGKNISMTCIADGKRLEFISEADIYSLFGNILDNAIEAADKVPDPDKRIISLHITQEGYFVHIYAENYFTDKLTFIDGLPQSTKGDSLYHGFGMRSIKMLVQKYGGSLKVYTKEDRFVLDIMFSV